MSKQILPIELSLSLTDLINIWVIDLGSEQYLGWHHRILIWEEQFGSKQPALVWSAFRSSNVNFEVSEVGLVLFSVDSYNYSS